MMSFVTRLTFAWKVWSGGETTNSMKDGLILVISVILEHILVILRPKRVSALFFAESEKL